MEIGMASKVAMIGAFKTTDDNLIYSLIMNQHMKNIKETVEMRILKNYMN